MAKKKMMLHEGYKVRVIAEGEGWSMVRKHGAYPFIVRSSELRQPTTLALDPPSALVNGKPSRTLSASNYIDPANSAGK